MTALALVDLALSANKDHQQDILDFASESQARLKAVDSLLKDVARLENEKEQWKTEAGLADDSEVEPLEEEEEEIIYVQGAVRAAGPSQWVNLQAADSPFLPFFTLAAQQRALQTPRPWTSKECSALSRSVQTECRRSFIIAAQSRGEDALAALEQFDPAAALRDVRGDELQWDNIARILSNQSSASPARTGTECRIQFLTGEHPEINHAQWGEEEQAALCGEVDARLEQARGQRAGQGLDWEEIVRVHNERFKTRRTVVQCLRTYRVGVQQRQRDYWTEEEDERLQEGVSRFGTKSWVQVARYVGNARSSKQARVRWEDSLSDTLRRGKWLASEDLVLVKAVAAQRAGMHAAADGGGGKIDWMRVAESVEGRNHTQCRLRWATLSEHARRADRPWTEEENARLVDAREQRKVASRSMLAMFPGRSTDMLEEQYEKLVQERAAQEPQRAQQRQRAPAMPDVYTPMPIHSSQILAPAAPAAGVATSSESRPGTPSTSAPARKGKEKQREKEKETTENEARVAKAQPRPRRVVRQARTVEQVETAGGEATAHGEAAAIEPVLERAAAIEESNVPRTTAAAQAVIDTLADNTLAVPNESAPLPPAPRTPTNAQAPVVLEHLPQTYQELVEQAGTSSAGLTDLVATRIVIAEAQPELSQAEAVARPFMSGRDPGNATGDAETAAGSAEPGQDQAPDTGPVLEESCIAAPTRGRKGTTVKLEVEMQPSGGMMSATASKRGRKRKTPEESAADPADPAAPTTEKRKRGRPKKQKDA